MSRPAQATWAAYYLMQFLPLDGTPVTPAEVATVRAASKRITRNKLDFRGRQRL